MKVSVIIPVYNTERYLYQCVYSILAQNFSDIEVILINDGSTDRSASICEALSDQYENVKFFQQPNQGVSVARNRGIEEATGDWVTFIDSDDYIDLNYFETLYSNSTSDWILINIDRDNSGIRTKAIQFQNDVFTLPKFVNKYSVYPHFPGPCAKFFQRKIINDNNLKFSPILKFGEDAVFNARYLQYCEVIHTANSSAYIYRETSQGLSKLQYDLKNDYTLFPEISNALKVYRGTSFYNKSVYFPLSRNIRVLYYDNTITVTERRKKLKNLIRQNFSNILEIYGDPKINIFVRVAYFLNSYVLLDKILSKLHR